MKPVFFSLLILPTLLTGCVTYKAIGELDDSSDFFVGDVKGNLMDGTAVFTLRSLISGDLCSGNSKVTYIPPSLSCAGQKGQGYVTCTSGKKGEIYFTAESCTSGYGRGHIDTGRTLTFQYGNISPEQISNLVAKSDRASVSNNTTINTTEEKIKSSDTNKNTKFIKSTNITEKNTVLKNTKPVQAIVSSKKPRNTARSALKQYLVEAQNGGDLTKYWCKKDTKSLPDKFLLLEYKILGEPTEDFLDETHWVNFYLVNLKSKNQNGIFSTNSDIGMSFSEFAYFNKHKAWCISSIGD